MLQKTKKLIFLVFSLLLAKYCFAQTYSSSEFLGPLERSGGYWGMGRVTDIAFHPTNANIFYVGAPHGGIWKTTNGGESYESIGDNLPYNSVGNIVVSKDNPQIIRVTLGDRMGWWNYGMGIYKTENGGVSWQSTSLVSDLEEKVTYLDMKESPHISDLILVATNKGVFRSENREDFRLVEEDLPRPSQGGRGNPQEIVFHLKNSNIVYLTWWDKRNKKVILFKSQDRGHSWKELFYQPFKSRGAISAAVTIANVNKLVVQTVVDEKAQIHSSLDNGKNWVTYDLEDYTNKKSRLFISQKNEGVLYTGFTKIKKSVDGGKSFENLTSTRGKVRVHGDQWVTVYNPLNDKIYWGNDGGIYEYQEGADLWKELSNTLAITQIHRASISQSTVDEYIIGTQDNGGAYFTPKTGWVNTNGGDAVSNAIDVSNNKVIFSTYPSGRAIHRTFDGWEISEKIEKKVPNYYGTATWKTPLALSSVVLGCVAVASENIFLSYDYGETWEKCITGLEKGDKIIDIQFSPKDNNSIYSITENAVCESSNNGKNWNIHSLDVKNLRRIIPHPEDGNKLWVVNCKYEDGKKVFFSSNRGKSFENISANLPNIPVYCLVYDDVTKSLFVGTELGIFFIGTQTVNWKKIDGIIPNTLVMDLEIHHKTRKLYVSTFGRGLWRIDIKSINQ